MFFPVKIKTFVQAVVIGTMLMHSGLAATSVNGGTMENV